MNVPVIIPTYDPSERILEVVEGLIAAGFRDIVIVNDGSRAECAGIFAQLEGMPQCTVLRHEVNRGKGRGLKTAFSYVLEHFPDCD